MQIIVNGETKNYHEGITLLEIIEDLNIANKVMAAALNTQIVKQENWNSCKINAHDKLELLEFVGGG